jgi:hypothetical protein
MAAGLPALAGDYVYRGTLDDQGRPANGSYDVRITAYAGERDGAPTLAPITFPAVPVKDGRFRLEFDAPLDSASPIWLEIAVRDVGASAFSVIPGRDKAIEAPLIGECWATNGDAGSNPAVNFLGTLDSAPLVLRVQNQRAVRYEPSAELSSGIPVTNNVIAGSSANSVRAGARGATIAGGGSPTDGDPGFGQSGPNKITDHYGFVGGGFGNLAGGIDGASLGESAFATVTGGYNNTARGDASSVGGGLLNIASGPSSAVLGGGRNRASGANSAVAGGSQNTASGVNSMVSGGLNNCAGGDYSWAGGFAAKVRPGSGSGSAGYGCVDVPLSGDVDGDNGSFVWADTRGSEFVSTGPDQFLIKALGGVGINAAPTAGGTELSVFGSIDVGGYANIFLRQNQADRGGILISAGDATAGNNNAALYVDQFKPDAPIGGQLRRMEIDGSGRLRVYVDGPIKPTAGSWSAPSDARLKHDIVPLVGALDRLLALRGVTFAYNEDAPSHYYTPGTHTGFVAQDVAKVYPEWVSADEQGYLLVGPQGFEAIAVEALRELRDDHERQLAQLREGAAAQAQELTALRAELAQLKAMLTDSAPPR